MVGHRCDHYDGNPSVSLTVHWYPHDCDVQAALYLDWYNSSPGRYRLRSASARGYLENRRALTIARAERLITSANCFFHGETSPPSPPS
ncbi:hypothetical protein ACFV24_22470 [Nocardia fluminea]|uniref:hypothetical protein n=1 Tax=Nocardia fluminea TaxID=134984 RepID=UPI00366FF32D